MIIMTGKFCLLKLRTKYYLITSEAQAVGSYSLTRRKKINRSSRRDVSATLCSGDHCPDTCDVNIWTFLWVPLTKIPSKAQSFLRREVLKRAWQARRSSRVRKHRSHQAAKFSTEFRIGLYTPIQWADLWPLLVPLTQSLKIGHPVHTFLVCSICVPVWPSYPMHTGQPHCR